MPFSPLWRDILGRSAPSVKTIAVLSDVTNVTTYTFTGVSFGDLGMSRTISGDVYGTNPDIRSPSRKGIVICIHGEDAASIFGVSSVTIGGVAGTEKVDAGGATLGNASIYFWNTGALDGITNTNIVVTWSEAVTSCAIGVLSIEGLGILSNHTTSNANTTGTGDLTLNPQPGTAPAIDTYSFVIVASTCVTQTELFSISPGAGGGVAPTILYAEANAEIAYAAAWSYSPQYNGDVTSGIYPSISSWSGATDGIAVCTTFV